MVVGGANRRGKWGATVYRYGVSVLQDEKIQEMDGGDGCLTI
jgi:hypothetical protein